jgi:hypothetical protein
MAELRLGVWNMDWLNDLFTPGNGPATFKADAAKARGPHAGNTVGHRRESLAGGLNALAFDAVLVVEGPNRTFRSPPTTIRSRRRSRSRHKVDRRRGLRDPISARALRGARGRGLPGLAHDSGADQRPVVPFGVERRQTEHGQDDHRGRCQRQERDPATALVRNADPPRRMGDRADRVRHREGRLEPIRFGSDRCLRPHPGCAFGRRRGSAGDAPAGRPGDRTGTGRRILERRPRRRQGRRPARAGRRRSSPAFIAAWQELVLHQGPDRSQTMASLK